MTGENVMATKASKWWEAVDVGITASERKGIEGHGYKLGRWSYRRKYVCPLCGKRGATETFRDLSIKEGSISPQMTIRCSGCKLELEDEPEYLAKMMA